MVAPEAALESYQRRQQIVAASLLLARRAWARMDLANLEQAEAAHGGSLLAAVVAGQQAATAEAVAYVDRVVRELDLPGDVEGLAQPSALVGVASDGRDLGDTMRGPLVRVREVTSRGLPLEQGRAVGESLLTLIVRSEVADAGRVAESVAIAARPGITGYTRQLNLPSCPRCIVLAGRFYRWNSGFLRHPRCDCIHVPASENVAGDLTTDPRAAFDSMTRAEQDRAFTKAGAEAIRDGADIGQVVNARRGMSTTVTASGRRRQTRRGGAFTTTEGITRRRGQPPRLMPESIYEIAGDDRAEAIRLLRANGYIT